MLIPAMLICCSLLLYVILTLMNCGKNLTHRDPDSKSEFAGSWAALDTRLPWYTSGFE